MQKEWICYMSIKKVNVDEKKEEMLREFYQNYKDII